MAETARSLMDYAAPPVAQRSVTGSPAQPMSLMDYLSEADLLNILNGTGIPERLALINDTFNPLAAIPRAQAASQEIFAPDRSIMQRIASTGDMLSEVGGVVVPMAVSARAGLPAATAVMEGLLGGSPTTQAASDAARGFLTDESGALRLWHGSPHDFDRFSLDKVGTGEGAQAYGYGLYFTERPDVARQYRDKLAPPQADTGYHNIDVALSRIYGGDWEAFKRDYTGKGLDDVVAEIEAGGGPRITESNGRVYEVAVDANTEDFLDRDALISQQPPAVRALLERVMAERAAAMQEAFAPKIEDFTRDDQGIPIAGDSGAALMQFLGAGRYRGTPEKTTKMLRDAGIAGIRYLDPSSRGAVNTSHNYVVFNDRLVNVLGKNGQRTTPEGKAQTILDMLTSGRASQITDEMLDLGDPTANARLNRYLYRNYDLPMDEASRVQRAGDMGFDTGTPLYHGTDKNFTGFEPSGRTGNLGAYSAKDPEFASEFAQSYGEVRRGGNVIPVVTRGDATDLTYLGGWANFEDAQDIGDALGVSSRKVKAAMRTGRGEPAMFEVLEAPEIARLAAEKNQNIDFTDLRDGGEDWNRVTTDLRNIRSRFARFDPRLAHLRNLSAGIAPFGLLALQPNEEQY